VSAPPTIFTICGFIPAAEPRVFSATAIIIHKDWLARILIVSCENRKTASMRDKCGEILFPPKGGFRVTPKKGGILPTKSGEMSPATKI
jgi:hypothetical protein